MAESLNAVRMTKRYRPFLDRVASGSKIINYAEKATGRDCDLCGHTPEQRDPKPGYTATSEEMRLMRVKLPAGVTDTEITAGKANFTVTGGIIELNVCKDTAMCRSRLAKMTDDAGNPLYDSYLLDRFR